MSKKLKKLAGLSVVLLTVLAVISVRLYYEYLQYLDIGYKYTTIFFTNLKLKILAYVLSFTVVFLIIAVNSFVIRKISYKYNDDWVIVKNPVYAVILSLLLAMLASTFISNELYENALTFIYSVSFGEREPLFGKDIGYYMFTRPFYMNVMGGIECVFGINIIFTVIAYSILWLRSDMGSLRGIMKNRHIVAHTLVNIMIFIVIIAVGYRFNIEELMYKSFFGVTGAGSTHMKIWYPYYKIAPFMMLLIVPLALYFLKKKHFKSATWTVAVFPIVWIFTIFAATAYQTMFVDSNELNKESKYLEYNMQMTKKAYNLENIELNEYEAQTSLTSADMPQMREASSCIDISDPQFNTDVYNTEQYIENGYKFYESDVIPYIIDGVRRTVSVSAREVSNSIKSADTSYSGSKFLNTYGSGMVMSSSNEDKYFIYGIPAVTDMGISGIANDRIYYGEKTNDTVVVNTGYDDENYIGIGGVQLTPFNRFVIGVCSGDFRLITNGDISAKSRAVMNRNIIQRVKKIAPFFEYDSDPYIVVDDKGVMKWVVDAYSVSDKYPYSQYRGRINYISPCAKVVIDAYSGTVDFYVINEKEPMMRMYRSIYPYVFSQDEMPENIRNYMRYPKDIFNIQADIYKKYYVSDVKEFYSGDSTLEYVKTAETGNDVVEPWYSVSGGKVSILVPYTKTGDNICAYLTSSCEPSAYGSMTMNIIGGAGFDTAVKAQAVINADEQVTKYINNLGKNGAMVRQGRLRMIPINKTAIFAAPLYITGEIGGKGTSMSDVIVVVNGKAAVSSDMETAIKTLMTSTPKAINTEESTGMNLITEIVDLYNRINLYRKVGDWENYGRAMKEFDNAMKELDKKNNDHYFDEIFVGPKLSGE